MEYPTMQETAVAARHASLEMAVLTGEEKNRALKAVGDELYSRREEIFAANRNDLERSQAEGLAAPLLKRLLFDEKKLGAVIQGIDALVALDEPVGKIELATELDKGLNLFRVSTPLGVIGMIFESRPDALVQISTLCLKSGNAVVLKGGREALETNRVLSRIIADATDAAGLPAGWINNIETREDVRAMLAMDQEIDLLIPRGSNEFVRYILENSRIPVMGHADGICHTYIHTAADPAMSIKVAVDSKAQYVAVCNATETILIDEKAAAVILPDLVNALEEAGVEVRGCPKSREISAGITPAGEDAWGTEYLDLIVSIRIVADLEDAVEHINHYGSGHTDAIITEDPTAAEYFMGRVDSANVFHNCSTRFSDGFRYGFGAEVGISTSKLHARGPVGLEGLLTYKYKLYGKGQIVADYATGARRFIHRPLKAD